MVLAVQFTTVPALIVIMPHHCMLEITIIALMIHYGMVNSVTMRTHVALVPTLHHGSVWSSLTVQVMISRCIFVTIKALLMKILLFNGWNSMSSKLIVMYIIYRD